LLVYSERKVLLLVVVRREKYCWLMVAETNRLMVAETNRVGSLWYVLVHSSLYNVKFKEAPFHTS
jgi:hypothetical protein